MDPYDKREVEALKERVLIEQRVTDAAIISLTDQQQKSRIRANLTYIMGGVLAFFGAIASFLSGADWSAFFSPEGAALAGGAVVFVRALVAFLQKPKA